MTFLYPLGLLGLIGIPVLILIYILKNKYTEQVVASTYLWRLSEKFLKKRLPINKLIGIFSLILQILAVLFISVAVAHPVLTIKNSADDYCFVLDCSGSMNMTQDGKTRFETAKEEIADIIDGAMNGSAFTLVTVGDGTEVIFEGTENKERALLLLSGVSSVYSAPAYTDAIGTAQRYFDENRSVKTYLFTDRSFNDNNNVTVVNVAAAVNNYAVTDVTYRYSGGKLVTEGKLTSYGSDAVLTVNLTVNYLDATGAQVKADYSQSVNVTKLEAASFMFECEQSDFLSLNVNVADSDALSLDNTVTVYNVEYENSYKVLLVSDAPFYIQAALKASGSARGDVISTAKYNADYKGYDLYVFDCYTPAQLPSDGAVWFFNPTDSVADSGFTVQDSIEPATGLKLSYSTSSASFVKSMLRNLVMDDVYVAEYQKCGFYRNFTTILTGDGNPLVFTGTNIYGNREVVFAFDLHKSNFPALMDYETLSRNLISYTFPNVIENSSYTCGDVLQINVTANCDSVRVESPLGKIMYLDNSAAVCETDLSEVGTYKITLMTGDAEKVYNVYCALPEEESIPESAAQAFSLRGEAEGGKRNGKYDDLLALFIVIAVLFAADWMVYCYEQYQLR